MIGKICDKGKGYEYKKLNWIRISNDELVINYQDKNDEECEEIGDIPEYLFVGEENEKEAEFHCGVEESGYHAYNCNDCPNKCEEWHQWDKETKNEHNTK